MAIYRTIPYLLLELGDNASAWNSDVIPRLLGLVCHQLKLCEQHLPLVKRDRESLTTITSQHRRIHHVSGMSTTIHYKLQPKWLITSLDDAHFYFT